MIAPVTKAVFPVAGLGSRFLPATKAIPKEMLPVVDKPLIQYAAEEAAAAGITDLILVTGRSKRAIEDHFDKNVELEAELIERNKLELLEELRDILPGHITCVAVRQAEPLGLGHAVLCALPAVGDAPFAVFLPDDFIYARGGPGCMRQIVDAYGQCGHSVLAVQRVDPAQTDRYGVVDAAPAQGQKLTPIHAIVEKPAPVDAPSNLAVVGRYVLTPKVMQLLKTTGRGAGGEIQLTDAIATLLETEPVSAYEFDGQRFDCGAKLGFLQAFFELALDHPGLGHEFRRYVEARIGRQRNWALEKSAAGE
ncbi:MAG: UTP--glucose-1-phosphate uridylyltransferase GalU [Gammaproteobacteria bacterium]|nr:UTP--glucose-1-phosphate uridylyltransferase GalU [Gammaproteobacteria bacterium]